MTSRPEAILIAGPTASGKSALAMRLAMRLAARLASDSGGLVINADSMQVYRDLRILTARPSEADECAVPHALFGTVDGRSSHSVRLWLADAARALAAASEAGAVPIFVGGTGLYFKALTLGLSDIPPVPEAVRFEVRAWAEGRPPEEIHATLVACDPAAAARLRPTDPQRLVRALEVFKATGRSLLTFQQQREPALLDATRCIAIYLAPDRAALRERLDQRFDRMMAEGALAEVARLAERRLDPALPIMRALGVPPLLRHLAGDLALDAAVAAAKADTRRYVKRQDTFARHQLPAFRPVVPEAAEAFLVAELQS